jgi:hypothetical protein
MNKNNSFNVLLMGGLLFVSFSTSQTAEAGIFKCTDASGSVYYNDKPCTGGKKEEKIETIKAPKNTRPPVAKVRPKFNDDLEGGGNQFEQKGVRNNYPAQGSQPTR